MRLSKNDGQQNISRIWGLAVAITAVALLRLLPHPPNFSPITAMALFSGWTLRRPLLAIAIPLLAMFISDLALGFHVTMPAVYLSIALVSWLGMNMNRKTKLPGMVGGAVAGSLIFFLVTNLAVFLAQRELYPLSWQGLVSCFVAALPFLQNSLAGDVFYTVLIVAGWATLQSRVRKLSGSPIDSTAL